MCFAFSCTSFTFSFIPCCRYTTCIISIAAINTIHIRRWYICWLSWRWEFFVAIIMACFTFSMTFITLTARRSLVASISTFLIFFLCGLFFSYKGFSHWRWRCEFFVAVIMACFTFIMTIFATTSRSIVTCIGTPFNFFFCGLMFSYIIDFYWILEIRFGISL